MKAPEGLQKLSVPIIKLKDCRASLQSSVTPILDDANLCAGGQEGWLNIKHYLN